MQYWEALRDDRLLQVYVASSLVAIPFLLQLSFSEHVTALMRIMTAIGAATMLLGIVAEFIGRRSRFNSEG